jgi:hypothetical protein
MNKFALSQSQNWGPRLSVKIAEGKSAKEKFFSENPA